MKEHAARKGKSFLWLFLGLFALWFLYYLGLKSQADTKNFFTFLIELPKHLPVPTSDDEFPSGAFFFYVLSVGMLVLYFSLSIAKFDPFPFIDKYGKQRYFNNLKDWEIQDEFHRFWRFYSLWNILPTAAYAALGYFWLYKAENVFGLILLTLHCIGIIVFRCTTGKAAWHMSGRYNDHGVGFHTVFSDWGRKPCPKCRCLSELGRGELIDSGTISKYSTYTSRDKIGELKNDTASYNVYADVTHRNETTTSYSKYRVSYRCPSCEHTWEEIRCR